MRVDDVIMFALYVKMVIFYSLSRSSRCTRAATPRREILQEAEFEALSSRQYRTGSLGYEY
jgi:hypothetical protein